jgi:hypothetical protein
MRKWTTNAPHAEAFMPCDFEHRKASQLEHTILRKLNPGPDDEDEDDELDLEAIDIDEDDFDAGDDLEDEEEKDDL